MEVSEWGELAHLTSVNGLVYAYNVTQTIFHYNSQITLIEGAGQTFLLAGMAFYYSYHFYYFSFHLDAEMTQMEYRKKKVVSVGTGIA